MRVLHVVARSHRRGAELVALELADELESLGHENVVLALGLGLDGSDDPELTPLARRTRLGVGTIAVGARRLRAAVADGRFDVVLAHGGWVAQVAALAVPSDGPLLVWQRILGFPLDLWRPSRRAVWRAVARRMDAAFALTSELEHELRRLGFARRVWVIPNSRQPRRFLEVDRTEEAARLRSNLGLGPGTALIGFVGHLVDQKRPDRAVTVLRKVREAGQDAHLVVAGDGPLRSRLERQVRSLGLSGHVTLLGHRRDVERIFGGIDLLVLTSAAEGIPGVAIEAQMVGCPVVSLPLGGVSEVIDHGRTGIVLDRCDEDAMADAVRGLLADPARRRAMGDEARRQAPRFAASRAAELYASRLEELVHGREDGAARRPGEPSGLRLFWYWPFARAEDSALAPAAMRPGDELVIQTLDRPGVPVSGQSDPFVVLNDVPEVRPAPERSIRWVVSRGVTYLARVVARRRALASGPYDVVHVMYGNRFTDAVDLALLRRRHRLVCSVHDAYPHEARLPRAVERRLIGLQFRNAGTIVVHNEHLRSILVEDFGIDPASIVVIPLQVPSFPGAAAATPDEPPVLLFFGTFRRNKGIDVLLDAFAALDRPDVRLHVAGRGFAEIESRVVSAAAADPRIRAEVGWITPERKSELFSRATAVVLPYTAFDSSSGVLHDAYGHGRPVVVSDVGWLGRTVREQGTGWVVPTGDAPALADALGQVLDDSDRRGRAASAARRVAEERRPEVVGAMLRDLYERLAVGG